MNTDLTKLLSRKVKTLNASSIVDVEIDISPDNENSMVLMCDEKYKKQIKVSFSGGDLRVSAEGAFNNVDNLKLILKTSSLEDIIISGTAYVSGFYKGLNLKVKISGTGNINLSGEVRDLNVIISGAGDACLKELEAQNVKLKLSGTSDAEIFASYSCEVNISGIGDATVYGRPEKIQEKVSGLGSVKQLGGKKKTKEAVNEMPVFGANIFDTAFNSSMFKNNDIAQEKARHKAAEEHQAEIYLIEMEMQRKIQELQNYHFNKPAAKESPVIEEPVAPQSVTARLKAKFKGLL